SKARTALRNAKWVLAYVTGALIGARARLLDDLRPFRDFDVYVFHELLGRVVDGIEAQRGESLLCVRELDHRGVFLIEPAHDRFRRAGRREKSDPRVILVSGKTRFGHRRDIGQRRHARKTRDSDAAKLAV